jgi:hypothetical protein
VQRNLELAVNLTRFWPSSSGIPVPPASAVSGQGLGLPSPLQQGASSIVLEAGSSSSGSSSSVGAAAPELPPGPVELTPCDVFELLRGRTLWIVG